MATLVNAVQINSKLVAKLNSSICAHFTNIEKSLDTLINKYQELNTATINAIDVESLKAVTSQINKAAGAFDEIGASIKEVHEKQKKLSDETSKGGKTSSIFSKIGKSDIFKKGKDELVEWIKSTDQYAAVRERLKAMGTEWLSSDSGVKVTNAINNALNVMANVIERVAGIALILASAIVDNWSWIAPIVLGIVAALIAYNVVAGIHSFITNVQKDGLLKAAAAQWGLNTAMLSCPIAWAIVAVIALIATFYAIIGVINKLAGTSISATGIIVGTFYVLGAVIANIFITLLNFIFDIFADIGNLLLVFFEVFANMFNDPVGSICRLFVGLADFILGIIETIANALDTLFGTNMADAVADWRNGMKLWTDENIGEAKISVGRVDKNARRLERLEYGTSYDAGYKVGSNFKFSLGSNDLLNNIADNTGGTNINTGSMADSVDMSNENLEYMRDLAEQEVVNRFATAEIKVDMTNHMAVNNDMDLDGVVAYLGERLNQEMQIAAEGVHI